MVIDDACGRQLPLFSVMSTFIGALKNHFLDKMTEKGLKMQTILWILTVPAMWSLECRNFMRRAAEHVSIKFTNFIRDLLTTFVTYHNIILYLLFRLFFCLFLCASPAIKIEESYSFRNSVRSSVCQIFVSGP